MLTVEICGTSIHKPLVHDLYREVHIGSHLTVLPVHRQVILTLLFLQENVTHVQGIGLGGDVEILGNGEILRPLLRKILHVTSKSHGDVGEIGRDLEVQNTVLLILEHYLLKVLGYRYRIYVGGGGQSDLNVFHHL